MYGERFLGSKSMNYYCVIREDSTVVVSIMYNRADGKYHFVNLTHDHICECGFDTVEDAVADMEKLRLEGKITEWKEIK